MQDVCEKMRLKMEAAISNKIENYNETSLDQFADDDKKAESDEYQKAFEPLTNVFIEVDIEGVEAIESVATVFLEEPKKEEFVKEEQDEEEMQANLETKKSYCEEATKKQEMTEIDESSQATNSRLFKANISKTSPVQENVQNEIDALSSIRGSKEWEDKIVKNVTGALVSMF